MTDSVEGIRWKIEEIDNEILDLDQEAHEHARVAMGHHKVDKAMPVRDMRVEEQVRNRYLARAKEVGISRRGRRRAFVAAGARVCGSPGPTATPDEAAQGAGRRRRGAMGQWLCRFFASRGHEVKVLRRSAGRRFQERQAGRGLSRRRTS
ncbi:MAG: hypothetical protein MZU84_00755 [Sphingobacterium sp.]|nr:hypothetical protein [Sphingobacterium sp.]